jgi:hypothetical protein
MAMAALCRCGRRLRSMPRLREVRRMFSAGVREMSRAARFILDPKLPGSFMKRGYLGLSTGRGDASGFCV